MLCLNVISAWLLNSLSENLINVIFSVCFILMDAIISHFYVVTDLCFNTFHFSHPRGVELKC